MRLGVMVALCLVGCGSAPSPRAHVVVLQPVTQHPTPPAASIPDDPAQAYALGYTWWHEGRNEDALRAFRSVIATLVARSAIGKRPGDKLRVEPGLATESVRDGDRVVVQTEGGLLLASSATGALERFVPLPTAVSLIALGGGLVAVATNEDEVLLDAASGETVERVAHAQAVTPGKAYFTVQGSNDSGVFVELWDAGKRKRLRTLGDPTLQNVMSVAFSGDETAVVAGDGSQGVVWEAATGERVGAFPGISGAISLPGFSPDGRFIAYGSVDFEKNPQVGTTFLLDRKTRKVVATSHASHYPSGYAFSKDQLAVGDLRRACLLRVPQMTLVACSPEVRPNMGPDDDLQDAHPTFVADARALAVETSDGSMLVAKVPSLATSWKGRAHLQLAPDHTAYLVDSENHDLLAVAPSGIPAHVRAIAEEENPDLLRETHPWQEDANRAIGHVSSMACHAGYWVFPAGACNAATTR